MYQQQAYQGYQPMRPPLPSAHPHGAAQTPQLHLQTQPQPQHPYPPYSLTASPASTLNLRQPPQSPSMESEKAGSDEEYYDIPGPKPTSHIWNGYVWALEVVQHPKRARMCGFGDKDRRPISPPPCIRLVMIDPNTKAEANYAEIDLTYLVLTVDIWDMNAMRELNLVKQSNASPCISSAATGAFPTTSTQPPRGHEQPPRYDVENIPGYASQTYVSPMPAAQSPYYQQNGNHHQPRPSPYINGQNSYPSPYQNGAPPQYGMARFPYSDPRYPQPSGLPTPHHPYAGPLPPMAAGLESAYIHTPTPNTQLYTRNLIGSLCASAFKLKDQNDKTGIWFVLQDLSVRTEGWFRLKMRFFNLQAAVGSGGPDTPNPPTTPGLPNEKTAPCLAEAFSNPFKVYSAKKFPGVVESTPLSKAFANQGIKIPIRKDTGGKRGREEDSGDESDAD